MRTIIAGSRSLNSMSLLLEAIGDSGFEITEVLSGAAKGVDRLGERWAGENGIPCRRFPADWTRFGKSAGYRRNEEMAWNADQLIAIWDGKSKGTGHMIAIALRKGLKVYVKTV